MVGDRFCVFMWWVLIVILGVGRGCAAGLASFSVVGVLGGVGGWGQAACGGGLVTAAYRLCQALCQGHCAGRCRLG